jgi:hypothetical protein
MNSAAERIRKAVGWAGVAALAVAALALSAGCADHGPTNLYSQPLFGVQQSGAHLEVYKVQQYSLTATASSHSVAYVVYLKNTGSGGTAGLVHAALSVTSCATVNQVTAVFGSTGHVIQAGDVVRGQAVDSAGNIVDSPFTFETIYDLAGCPGATLDYSVTATDAYNDSWTSGFTAVSQ